MAAGRRKINSVAGLQASELSFRRLETLAGGYNTELVVDNSVGENENDLPETPHGHFGGSAGDWLFTGPGRLQRGLGSKFKGGVRAVSIGLS
jgi:hypothetical protein